jgi:four helix bundle protein
MPSYKELEVYKRSHRLGIDLHEFSLKLPKYELYETGSQLRRSSKSISVNIVEGYGRRKYQAEFIRFLIFAIASCDETAEWLTYIKDCHKKFADQATDYLEKLQVVGKQLNKYIQSIEKRK